MANLTGPEQLVRIVESSNYGDSNYGCSTVLLSRISTEQFLVAQARSQGVEMISTPRRSFSDQNFGRWRPKIALWRFGFIMSNFLYDVKNAAIQL